MANIFNEDGTYNKTEWKSGDTITSAKLNKIESSLEAINNNDIDRHVETDSRLDDLEESIKNSVTKNELKTLETLVGDNKDATALEFNTVENHISTIEGRVNTVEGRVDELGISFENSKIHVNAMFPPDGILGCKCDLEIDDTEALQNIINYVYQKGGGTVYIPNSILLSNVIIETGVTLSMGPMAVKYTWDLTQTKYIKKKSGSSGTLLTFRPYSKGVNIIIEGNKDDASGDGILFDTHSQGTDIYVSKCRGHGIIHNLGVMLNNVHSSYNGSRGLYAAGSDSVVSNFYLYGNNEGLYFDSGVSNCNYCNGKIEWNGINISAYQSSENYLTNINIDRSTLWGLRLIGGNHYFSNCRIWRNYSSSNEPEQGSSHIYIEGGSSVFISNSSITIGADDGKTEPTSPNYVCTGWNTPAANVYLSNCNLVNCSKTNIISPYSGSSIAIHKNNCME